VFFAQALRVSDVERYEQWLSDAPNLLVPALLHGARGANAYQRGAFVEATREHRVAAKSAMDWVQRVSAWSNAAASAVEIPDSGLARDALARVQREIEGRVAPSQAVRAHWLQRLIDYRLGDGGTASPDHLRATEAVSERWATQLALVEGAAAWRSTSLHAEVVVDRAARGYRRHGHVPGALLAEGLLAAIRGTPEDLDVEVLDSLPPAFTIQLLALHRLAGGPPLEWGATMALAVKQRPGFLEARLDVLSLNEARTLLEGGVLE